MNWMGGARSRIEKKNEKKVQKLFFERKRQEKKFGIISNPNMSPKKKGFSISQDLLSFHTVMRAHDRNVKLRGSHKAKLKHVEIDDLTPARIQHNISSLSTSPIGKSSIDFQRVHDEKRPTDFNQFSQRIYDDKNQHSLSSSNSQQYKTQNSSFPPFGSHQVSSHKVESNNNQKEGIYSRETRRRALHQSPVAASTPMYPVYGANKNFPCNSYETSTLSKKQCYGPVDSIPPDNTMGTRKFSEQFSLNKPTIKEKLPNTKRASYFNLFKDSQKACSSNDLSRDRFEQVNSSNSDVEHIFASHLFPNIHDEKENCKENEVIRLENNKSPFNMHPNTSTYNVVASSPSRFEQKSLIHVIQSTSEQLAPFIPKSPVISPCLLPDRFKQQQHDIVAAVPDFSHLSNSKVSYEKVRITLDDDEEDFNPYNRPGPHSTINLNQRSIDPRETERRDNSRVERGRRYNCIEEPSLASYRDHYNVYQDQAVCQQWISPKAAQKHIDNLLNDRGRESSNGDGFSSSSSLSDSSISASGRTSSYNGGCSSIHESRTSNGNLSVASNDGVSNFRNKGHLLRKPLDDCGGNVSKGAGVADENRGNGLDQSDREVESENFCYHNGEPDNATNTVCNETTYLATAEDKENCDTKDVVVAPPVTNNNPETAVGDGDAQTYCVESENLCADDKYSCTGESSLEFYLNQSLFDLKKHDIFLYEQHLMLKAFLISACEC